MKLKDFQIYSYETPLKGKGVRKGFLIKLTNEDGKKGIGEIAPLPGWSQESYEDVLASLKNLRLKFLDGDLSPIYLPPSILFGMECAIWQLQNELEEDISIEISSKIKLGDDPLEGALEKASTLIKEKGPIKVDFNRKWDLEKAVEFAKHFTPDEIVYIEEPVKNFTDLEKFYEKTGIGYAVDEHLLYHPIERILPLEGLSHLVIKPMLHGGFSKCRDIVEKAKNLSCIFSCTYESEVGLSHIANISRILLPEKPIGIGTIHLLEHSLSLNPSDLNRGILKRSWFNKMELQQSRLKELV